MDEKCFLYNECNHIDCGGFCLRKYKLEALYTNAQISSTQRCRKTLSIDADGTDLEQFKTLSNIEKDIVNFVNQGQHLYLYSANCGNGKTSWALRLAQAYLNEVWTEYNSNSVPVLFINVADYLSAIKANISTKNEYVERLNKNLLTADMVIWDDIGTKNGSEYEINNLLRIIDTRISRGKSNIYTSNLNLTEMHTALGDRLASRICNCSVNIKLSGADKRHFSVLYNK